MQMIALSGGFSAKIHDPAVAEYNKKIVITLLTPLRRDQHIFGLVPGHPVKVPVDPGVHIWESACVHHCTVLSKLWR